MRALSITIGVAVAALAAASSACDSMPTATDAGSIDNAAVSFNAQPRVSLCHRVASGEYIEITVADAAYQTHMAHGDTDIGPGGGCGETARLTLIVGGGGSGAFVTVTVAAFGSVPETALADCPDGDTCYYDVPAGSTVMLVSLVPYSYWTNQFWLCGEDGWEFSCLMSGDITVNAANW